MENVASNNTQSAIKHCPVFTGRNKKAFREYKTKLRVCLSLYRKLVCEVLQSKAQELSSLTNANATLNAVAEQTMWKQANQDLWSVLLLTTSDTANIVVKTFEV